MKPWLSTEAHDPEPLDLSIESYMDPTEPSFTCMDVWVGRQVGR